MAEVIRSVPWVVWFIMAPFLIWLGSQLICTTGSVLTNRQRERSRREIAAYVAEGSMTPDDAERLLSAGGKSRA